MKRAARVLLLLLFLAATTALAGEKATDFTFEDINPASATYGQKITLSEQYAGDGVLVNFLASWCTYCWEELPLLQELVDAGEVKVLGMVADEYGAGPDLVLSMVARKELTLPILWVDVEQAQELEKRYAYQFLPATYLIRADGTITEMLEGAVSPERLYEEIARAFR
ncbi:MAG: TlpA disulfide reductase family protein [Acidobacteriota bacterium]